MSTANGTNNVGHGHVYKRPDGVLARCGGPAICVECSGDYVRQNAREHKETAVTARTPPLETGALLLLKNLAAANAREGLASYTESASLHSMCDELLTLRNSHDALVAAASAGLEGLSHMEGLYRTYASGARKRGNGLLEAKHSATAAAYADTIAVVRAALKTARGES